MGQDGEMGALIEDYGIIGDTRTVALVDRSGSIDWWCAPRIDSGACFAALVGEPRHGRWLISTVEPTEEVNRAYHPDTLVLETIHRTAGGTVAVIDFMSPDAGDPTIFRVVEGREGTVSMQLELIARFDYGSIIPWVQRTGDGLTLVAGGDGLVFSSPIPLQGRDFTTVAEFSVSKGQQVGFSLAWYPAVEMPPLALDPLAALRRTEAWWQTWVGRCTYAGEWRDDVVRSLITLKALSYAPTGAITAAATTSLPEKIGGVRNWDYRYSWLRDASFTLEALLLSGYTEEALAWHHWLRRAVAGKPGDVQIMYGVGGERRLTELELDWLPGYEGSRPVRIGNQASEQFQLDVFGEVLDAAWTAVRSEMGQRLVEHQDPHGAVGDLLPAMMQHLESVWTHPDDSIWEIRGPRRHFTHSKVMAWVAFDRAIRIADALGWDSLPIDRWADLRDEIHEQVCARGWSEAQQSFVQYYGSERLDSSLLMLARVGFLPPTDPRIIGTVDAIQRELVVDGFVLRYATEDIDTVDGLPPGEGTFLLTTFWLADNLALIGRRDEAMALFERLRALQNDVGLFSEEYDPVSGRMLGNVPQAFSHLAFIISAASLSMGEHGPMAKRTRAG